MPLHLLDRLYLLLWRMSRKKIEFIEDHRIEYLSLPWWMVYNGPDARLRWGGSQVITHRPTKTIVILMSNSECKTRARYTLYHEFIEGCCQLSIGVAQDKETLASAIISACVDLNDDAPALRDRIDEYSRNTGDWEHSVALLLELQLIKKEQEKKFFQAALVRAFTERL